VRVPQQGTTVSYWLLPGQNLPPEIPTEDIICDPDDILPPLSPREFGTDFQDP
jgi:hypothetical protein